MHIHFNKRLFIDIFVSLKSVIIIELDVEVLTQNNDFNQAKTSLEQNVTNAKTAASMQSIDVGGAQSMTLNNVTDTPTTGVCINGSIYGLNQDFGHNQKCRK